MQDRLVWFLIVAGPLSLLIAARWWRARRLSDRAMTRLVVGLAPAMVFVFGIIQGSSWLFILATTGLLLIPGLVLYRVVFDIIQEHGALPR